ncbi:AraC family transcriptional regulator [Methylobacterium terricola]|uniref:AraC family transcriptional regulator n=2 Tax=Methylobacterium terricola TaxID=2583531 RepID=A0A5C4LLQ6_9HYPH|nr:AraC family transcriptional regulator [Methylobacterium terricola]
MARDRHEARHHRSGLSGLEAMSLASARTFPRHGHDQLGLGVIVAGGHRSWSGRGPVEALAGDVITVNPGEIHDGAPVRAGMRAWRMLYVEPHLLDGLLCETVSGPVEITRPAVSDPALAAHLVRLFADLIAPTPDPLAIEETMVRTLTHLVARHGSRPVPRPGPPPFVTRALHRIEEAPERPTTLAELAGLSGVGRFQLLRGFARAVGTTPHAYLLQHRVRLARRLLGAGRSPAAAAAESGFADQSHLTRAFVRQFGVTPARTRAALA